MPTETKPSIIGAKVFYNDEGPHDTGTVLDVRFHKGKIELEIEFDSEENPKRDWFFPGQVSHIS